MLLAVDRPRAKEILSERQTLGSELRSRAGGVSDVAGFTRWHDDVREWEHGTADVLESLFTTRQAAAALESERVKRVSLVTETHAERFDRRQEDLRRELAFVTALRDRLYTIEEAPPNFRRDVEQVSPGSCSSTARRGPATVVARLLEQTRSGKDEIAVLDELRDGRRDRARAWFSPRRTRICSSPGVTWLASSAPTGSPCSTSAESGFRGTGSELRRAGRRRQLARGAAAGAETRGPLVRSQAAGLTPLATLAGRRGRIATGTSAGPGPAPASRPAPSAPAAFGTAEQ